MPGWGDAGKDSALDIAAVIIERRPGGVDQMQLHKLLYLVQAASLAWFKDPAFTDERIEAWTWGPMVRGVAGTYQQFGEHPITEPIRGHSAMVSERTKKIVESIVSEYGDFSGPDLARLVKRAGSPWRSARGDLPDGTPSDAEITRDSMLSYHRTHGVTWVQPTPPQRRLAQRAHAGDTEAMADFFEQVVGVRPLVS